VHPTSGPGHNVTPDLSPSAVAMTPLSDPSPIGRVLVIDDTLETIAVLRRMLERDGHAVDSASDAEEALGIAAEGRHDLVLLDVMMPGRDGFNLCRAIKRHPRTVLTPVVMVTGLQDLSSRIKGIDAGADDFLCKPVNMHELRARVRSLVRLKRRTDDLESAESIIVSLALTIEARDASTQGHCQRLAAYGVALGRALGLSGDDLAALQRGGYLHDVGKVGVPDAILLKPGRFTADEALAMQAHTVIGDRLCGELRSLRLVRTIVRHHHERLDGSGYPDGLVGEAIPLLAQITGIVDVYDALTSVRPYKTAYTSEQAIAVLLDEVRRGWRSERLVRTFIDVLQGDAVLMALATHR
jgi:putative two-component system response regulator